MTGFRNITGFRKTGVRATLIMLTLHFPAHSATIEIYPGDSFRDAVQELAAGDTLIVHSGKYSDAGRISITVKGTPERSVLITGAPGEPLPLITREANTRPQNTINIEGAEHLTINRIEISSNGGDGISLNEKPAYITLENLVIHDISVGINFRSDMHHITVRRTHIYRTNDTGEGMYIGCNYAKCAVSDSLIENNWIHDTVPTQSGNDVQGDGIEIKRGSHSNIIRDNVIHDTNWPCILLYGTEGHPKNIVEGNVMWNCGDSGIQAAADALIRNNIIFASPGVGFNSRPHQGVTPSNLEFTNNTIIGGHPCIDLRGWNNRQGLVLANNAIYCAGGLPAPGTLIGVTIAGNVILPGTARLKSKHATPGRSVELDFTDPANRSFYPSTDSPLIDAGESAWMPATDFNGTPRDAVGDAGAYEKSAPTNPGWAIMPGFKERQRIHE
jgi:hypothetical protein